MSRPIAIDDILHLRVPTGVRLAPDGRSLVWVERRVDDEGERMLSRLVLCRPPAEPFPFTTGRFSDSAPRFGPDATRIAFVRSPLKNGGGPPKPQRLCVIPADGGEARTLLEALGTFSAPVWSPDGRYLVVSFRRADPLPEGRSAPWSIRVTRLSYKVDGVGYLPQDRFHLYRVDTVAAEPTLEPLTDPDGDWDDTDPVFSPDGTRLAFLCNREPDRDRDVGRKDLYVMPAEGGEPTRCTHRRGMSASPAWAPDGTWLALLRCVCPPGQELGRRNVDLHRVSADGSGDEVNLTAPLDRCVMNLTIDDVWGLEHWMQPPVVLPDGRGVLCSVSDQGTTALCAVRLDEAGRPTGVVDRIVDDRIVVAFDAAPSARRLALLTSSPTEPGRIETCELEGGDRKLAAWPLGEYCGSVDIRTPRELRVASPDGNEVHGWIVLPPGDGPFPLLLDVHGGPVIQFGPGFFHELQCLTARGYAVLLANPRGSQGYGADFAAAIHRDWGDPPFRDLMAVVDHALETFPIDPERLGVLGGSYGGFMTTWIIARTDRFKAACTQRTVSSMEGLIWSDFGSILGDELEAQSWEDPELYARLSPVSYAERINTPLLITQGLGDLRTPADQGERLYVTLRLLGKEAEMVLFPGGNHDLSRNGPPGQRLERLRVILEFFDRHLTE